MKFKKPNKHDKVRMIFYSNGDSESRQFEFNLQKLFVMIMLTAVVMGAVFLTSVTITNGLNQNNINNKLKKTNLYLSEQVTKLQDNIQVLQKKINSLEEDTEDLEVLAGLTSSTVDSNLMFHSFSEDNKQLAIATIPIDYDYSVDKMDAYLNDLEYRIKRASEIQGLIEDKFLQTRNTIEHVPSIRPVQGGRITDKFGIRKDPFVERVKHHNGIDLTARYGTKVYAAAAGVVEFVRTKYRLNAGYGRVVIINHGNGYKTLYGHLSKIKVKKGQKVKRWDVIGLSGNTGRATGPHLHYEVWKDRRAKNPENYMLN
ncbi:MAG: M23 family metallopeptidase [bacterium]